MRKPIHVRSEYANGEGFSFGVRLNQILKTQDLDEWKKDPTGFNQWVRDTMSNVIKNIDFVIIQP